MPCLTRKIDMQAHEALNIVGYILKWLRFGYGGIMEIQIDKHACKQIQTLTSIRLTPRDYEFFADWLILIGVATAKAVLEKHPELTVGDLAMMQFRCDRH